MMRTCFTTVVLLFVAVFAAKATAQDALRITVPEGT